MCHLPRSSLPLFDGSELWGALETQLGGQLWPGWDPKSLHSKARAGAGKWVHQWQKAT